MTTNHLITNAQIIDGLGESSLSRECAAQGWTHRAGHSSRNPLAELHERL